MSCDVSSSMILGACVPRVGYRAIRVRYPKNVSCRARWLASPEMRMHELAFPMDGGGHVETCHAATVPTNAINSA